MEYRSINDKISKKRMSLKQQRRVLTFEISHLKKLLENPLLPIQIQKDFRPRTYGTEKQNRAIRKIIEMLYSK